MSGIPGVVAKVRRRSAEVVQVARDDGVRAAGPLVGRLVGHALGVGPARLRDLVLDLRLGGRTRGVLRNEDLLRARSIGGDSNWYEPVQPRKFRRILTAVDLDPRYSTFLDLGAGRGRAMLLAAQAGFGTVVGVELDPALAAEADRNVARWMARRGPRSAVQLSVLHQDAVETAVPDGPVLVFLYNSFGPKSLRAVLERLTDSYVSAPRPMWLCYLNAQHASVVAEYTTLGPRVRRDDWIVYEFKDTTASEASRPA